MLRMLKATATRPRPSATVEHDREGDQRRAPECPERVEHVTHRGFDERGAALVAALVGGERHRPEAFDGGSARLGRGHPVRDQLLRFRSRWNDNSSSSSRSTRPGANKARRRSFQSRRFMVSIDDTSARDVHCQRLAGRTDPSPDGRPTCDPAVGSLTIC